MFRIAVCDEQPQDMEAVISLLRKYKIERLVDIEVFCFDLGDVLLESLECGQDYDLYLLDISCDSGVELAKKIRNVNTDALLVFLSSSADYAMDAFRLSATQYFIKSINEAAFFDALDKILSAYKRNNDRSFLFPMATRTIRVFYSEIIYIEINAHIVTIHLVNGDVLPSKTIRVPFAEAIAPLLSDGRFLQAHKSFAVNMDYVRELNSKCFVMTDGSEIPIPSNKAADAKKKYHGWLEHRGIGVMGSIKENRKRSVKRAAALSLIFLMITTVIFNLNPSLSAAAYEIPVIGDIIKVLTLNRFAYKDKGYEAEITVPQIQGLLDPELEEKLNADFREYADELILSFEETILEIEELGIEENDPNGGIVRMSIKADYQIKADNDTVLSIDAYIYSDVNGFVLHKFCTINKRTGTLVTLSGLFKEDADYITPISRYIVEEMTRRNEEEGALYVVGDTPFNVFTEIKPDQNFYVNDDGKLVICFDKYEVAAAPQGSPEFAIPTELLKDISSTDLISQVMQ